VEHVEHLLLVPVVRVGVQEADAEGGDARVAEEPGGGDGVGPVEGADLGARGVKPPRTVRTRSAGTIRGGLTQK
jgi:hypothetical protein